MLVPTSLGCVTTDLMKEYFPEIVDYEFTAQMEDELDDISSGKNTVEGVLSEFYDKFKTDLERAQTQTTENKSLSVAETTDMICEKCGAVMVVKSGRYGKFAACPNYPACKNTKPIKEASDEEKHEPVSDKICDKCGSPMILRTGRYGKFYACSAFPKCRNIMNVENTLGVNCPLCGKPVVMKKAKSKTVFYSCSDYPNCNYSSWDKPSDLKCPSCGKPLYYKKGKDKPVCTDKECEMYGKGLPDDEQTEQSRS